MSYSASLGLDFDFSAAAKSAAGGGGDAGGSASGGGEGKIDIDWSKVSKPEELRAELKSKSRAAIQAGAPKAAAGACTVIGAAGAAPLCAKVGAKLAKPIADAVDWVVDNVWDGISKIGQKRKKPPILITPADARTLTPEEVQYYNLKAEAYTLYVDTMAAYDLALQVIADKQQKIQPGSTPWPPHFIARVLKQNGLSLVPAVLNGKRQWKGDFLAATLGIQGKATGDGVKFPIFDDAKYRQWERLVEAWGATHDLVPPYLPEVIANVVALPRPLGDKSKLLAAVVQNGQRWLLTLEVAATKALTTYATNVVQNQTYQRMLPELRKQVAADYAAKTKARAEQQAAADKPGAAVLGKSSAGWIWAGAAAVGAVLLLKRRRRGSTQ